MRPRRKNLLDRVAKKLAIVETCLNKGTETTRTGTDVDVTNSDSVSLCPFGDHIFALTVTARPSCRAHTALLISPGPLPITLSETEVVDPKILEREAATDIRKQMAQIPLRKVLVGTCGSSNLFVATISASELRTSMTPLALTLPGFIRQDCLLMATTKEKAIAIGGCPCTNRVTLIEVPGSKRTSLAPLPGPDRYEVTSTVLGKFVIGFGEKESPLA